MNSFGPAAVTPKERQRLLTITGPQLSVRVANPITAQSGNELSSRFHNASKKITALIDTGASMNCIDNGVAKQIGLLVVDHQIMSSTSSKGMTPVYWGEIHIHKLDETITGQFFGTNLIYSGQENHMLLGRPFLENYIMTYDGPDGMFHLKKPTAPYQSPMDV